MRIGRESESGDDDVIYICLLFSFWMIAIYLGKRLLIASVVCMCLPFCIMI